MILSPAWAALGVFVARKGWEVAKVAFAVFRIPDGCARTGGWRGLDWAAMAGSFGRGRHGGEIKSDICTSSCAKIICVVGTFLGLSIAPIRVSTS